MYRRVTTASVAICCIAMTAACGPADSDGDRALTPVADSPAVSIDSLPSGALFSTETTSCVESYNPMAVRGRAFAFDGEVVAVGPPVTNRSDGADLDMAGVTFAVHEWFAGSSDDTFTVDMLPPTQGSQASDENGPAYAIGSRLLVSGEPRWGGQPHESPIAWTCGFTRYYDQQTAAQWRAAAQP